MDDTSSPGAWSSSAAASPGLFAARELRHRLLYRLDRSDRLRADHDADLVEGPSLPDDVPDRQSSAPGTAADLTRPG